MKYTYYIKNTRNISRLELEMDIILFGRKFTPQEVKGDSVKGTVTIPLGAWGIESLPFWLKIDDLYCQEDNSVEII